MQALFDLHGATWEARGQPGMLRDETVRKFHLQAGARLRGAGMVRLYGLQVDGVLKGVLYCLARARRVYYYLSGYDPSLAVYSPGSILISHALTAAAEEGSLEFDFLRGGEPYKRRWGAQLHMNQRILIR
jgi:CelD/BcsL family acetyltransferase involved in cellulose biosynthesis